MLTCYTPKATVPNFRDSGSSPDGRSWFGGLLYMVAYNLRKVENRDRYPDPPFASNRRNSLVAGLRVVAAAAWVRFPVSAILFVCIFFSTKKKKKYEARGIRTPNFWV